MFLETAKFQFANPMNFFDSYHTTLFFQYVSQICLNPFSTKIFIYNLIDNIESIIIETKNKKRIRQALNVYNLLGKESYKYGVEGFYAKNT